MLTALITGIIGIVLFIGFVGFMVAWVKALPMAIIVVFVTALMIYDFVQTMRAGESGA